MPKKRQLLEQGLLPPSSTGVCVSNTDTVLRSNIGVGGSTNSIRVSLSKSKKNISIGDVVEKNKRKTVRLAKSERDCIQR